MVNVGERYRHFKGEKYEIVAVARDCEDPERQVVVYRGFYDSDDFGKNPVWVRDYDDFVGVKIFDDGRRVERFELIDSE